MSPGSDGTPSSENREFGGKVKKGALFLLGTVFLIFAGIGIFLPILPTTPFLLLSAGCYYKSSRRMHNWMMHNKWFGDYIRNYSEGKGISMKAKFFTLSLLWAFILYSIFVIASDLVVQFILLAIAIGVTIHIIKLPTYQGE